jgi:hypothetical protein
MESSDLQRRARLPGSPSAARETVGPRCSGLPEVVERIPRDTGSQEPAPLPQAEAARHGRGAGVVTRDEEKR